MKQWIAIMYLAFQHYLKLKTLPLTQNWSETHYRTLSSVDYYCFKMDFAWNIWQLVCKFKYLQREETHWMSGCTTPGLPCQAFTSNYWINSYARRKGPQRQMNYTTWIWRAERKERRRWPGFVPEPKPGVSSRPARDDTPTQGNQSNSHKVPCLFVLSSSSSASLRACALDSIPDNLWPSPAYKWCTDRGHGLLGHSELFVWDFNASIVGP